MFSKSDQIIYDGIENYVRSNGYQLTILRHTDPDTIHLITEGRNHARTTRACIPDDQPSQVDALKRIEKLERCYEELGKHKQNLEWLDKFFKHEKTTKD